MSNDDPRPRDSGKRGGDGVSFVGVCLAIGAGLGAALGIVTGNMPVGLAVGVGLGVAVGAGLDVRRGRRR